MDLGGQSARAVAARPSPGGHAGCRWRCTATAGRTAIRTGRRRFRLARPWLLAEPLGEYQRVARGAARGRVLHGGHVLEPRAQMQRDRAGALPPAADSAGSAAASAETINAGPRTPDEFSLPDPARSPAPGPVQSRGAAAGDRRPVRPGDARRARRAPTPIPRVGSGPGIASPPAVADRARHGAPISHQAHCDARRASPAPPPGSRRRPRQPGREGRPPKSGRPINRSLAPANRSDRVGRDGHPDVLSRDGRWRAQPATRADRRVRRWVIVSAPASAIAARPRAPAAPMPASPQSNPLFGALVRTMTAGWCWRRVAGRGWVGPLGLRRTEAGPAEAVR